MRLGGWSLLTDVNHSYDLPRSNMAQQHPGAGGYKVEPGVPPNAGDHEPVSWHISIYLVLRYHSHRVAAKCCRMLYGLYSGLRGLPSLPEQSVPLLTWGVSCSLLAAIYCAGGETVLG